MSKMTEDEEYQVKVICDDTVYMMFDLDNGNMLAPNGDKIIEIDNLWKFSYKRQLVSETIEGYMRHTVNNFVVKVWYNDTVILDFDTFGAQSKFTIRTFEGFHAGMFQEVLDNYRKLKFNVV